MGHKRVGIRPTGGVLQHRHVDLSKAVLVEVIARRLPKHAAAIKALTHRWVNIHIHIAAAKTLFLILELFWHWPQSFGEQPQLTHAHRNLTRLRPQHRARRFDKVAGIEELELLHPQDTARSVELGHCVALQVKLHFAARVLQFDEGQLAKATNGQHAPSHRYLVASQFVVLRHHCRTVVCALSVCWVRVDA